MNRHKSAIGELDFVSFFELIWYRSDFSAVRSVVSHWASAILAIHVGAYVLRMYVPVWYSSISSYIAKFVLPYKWAITWACIVVMALQSYATWKWYKYIDYVHTLLDRHISDQAQINKCDDEIRYYEQCKDVIKTRMSHIKMLTPIPVVTALISAFLGGTNAITWELFCILVAPMAIYMAAIIKNMRQIGKIQRKIDLWRDMRDIIIRFPFK